MKLLIIGPNSKENQMLVRAAKEREHEVKRVSISRLSFILDHNKFSIKIGNKDIAEFNTCLIRGINPYFAKAKTVAKYLHRHKVAVVDRELYQKVYVFDKIFMYAALNYHKLPCPDTFYFFSEKEYVKSMKKFEFPVILKDLNGMHGRNIYFLYTEEELLRFLKEKKIRKFFVQQFIDADYYYRVFVIGRKVLGAMKRYTLKVQNERKILLGERSMPGEIPRKDWKIALKAARAANSDIAGVDMIYDKDGKPYIMEVNRSPQFKRFSQVMGVNVAEEIVKYLE